MFDFAGELWKEWGHKKQSTNELYSQIRKYRLQQKPYNKKYSKHDNPLNWWMLINDGHNQLSRLAIKLFSVTPYSASCERIFSSLGWFFGKRRQRLDLKTLQSMAKIHRYSLSNMKTSVGHLNETYKEEELRDLLSKANNNLEDDIEDNVEDNNVEEQDDQNNQNMEELENVINDKNLIIEKSIDLGPWVVIEINPPPNITIDPYNSSDDDDDDFDPKELAKKNKINVENNEYIFGNED